MSKADDREHPRVIVRHPHGQGGFDEILASPRLRTRPPAPMCNRHQRAQSHVSVAPVAQLFGDRYEGPRGTRLEPDAATEDLTEPGKPREGASAEIERRRLIDQPPSALDETELVGHLRGGDKPCSLASR